MLRKRASLLFASLLLFGLLALVSSSTVGASQYVTFHVTVENLTPTQPFSPPVAVTHRLPVRLFHLGGHASHAIEAIAEDGNQSVAVAALTGSPYVTDLVDIGMPLTPNGVTVGDFTDTADFYISAQRGDRLSLAGMLICTNDGFFGADGARLPRHGSVTYYLNAYDSGTEYNTEASADIVDPCSGLGPVVLNGDPNGNNNDGIDSNYPISMHAGVQGNGDLLSAHDWDGAVAKLTITRID